MRICVVGAGAIGGLLGGRMALAGESVTFIEMHPGHREAINKNGLTLLMHGGETLIAKGARATENMAEAGPQDLVVVAVKAHQIPAIAPGLRKLFGRDTIVMTVQNGIPWWYFHKHGGPFDGKRLASVDPDGSIDANIEPDRIVGCVVYPAGEVAGPGVIKHVEGDRFPVGELDGSTSNRVQMIQQTLIAAGFKSFVLDNIRAEIWLKAWGNLSFNPISALTHGTLEGICKFPLTRELAARMMEESQAIANKLGITFRHTIEKRIAGAEAVGPHKTSMLQDVEAGRGLEVEALIGAIVELGRLTGTPTPHI
ncbi:MAG TPA: 2-dehydropantoate 2-reductase, partial [Alphaproteobacteria bacterium]|nr:2-dehydropantoate 2-reductase [Alphaproteobacteria bacterium]